MIRINTRVNRAIKRREEMLKLYRHSAGGRDPNTGRSTTENHTEVDQLIAVLTPTSEDYQMLEDGERSKGVKSIYSRSELKTSNKSENADIILYAGEYWKIQFLWDRQLGAHWKALAVRYREANKVHKSLPVIP